MRHPNLARLAGLLFGLPALLAGCSLFEPTSPEVGDVGETLLPSYAAPESCLKYLVVGVVRKDDLGLAAYTGALADSTKDGIGFHAFFDPAVWNAYTGVKPDDWNLDYETQFYSALTTLRAEAYGMAWLPDEYNPYDIGDDLAADTCILHRQYKVWAISGPDSLLIAIGYADLRFARISASRWALTRWQDRVDPEIGANPTNDLWRTFGYRRLNAAGG